VQFLYSTKFCDNNGIVHTVHTLLALAELST